MTNPVRKDPRGFGHPSGRPDAGLPGPGATDSTFRESCRYPGGRHSPFAPMFLNFRSRSLRSQLALVFGVLVVGVAVTLALSLAALLKQRIEREEGHQLRTLAGNVGQVLADNLFHRSREIEVLAGAEDMWTQ